MKYLISILLTIVLFSSPAWATFRYVDTPPAESGSDWNGSNGGSYTGSPGGGFGYTTIQAGVNAMNKGDIIYMRGDTYDVGDNAISLDGKNGTSWTEGNFYKMASYPGEWAIVDGERRTPHGVVIYGKFPAYDSDVETNYWILERFEITGGGATSGENTCSAIWLNVGPFIYRYLYIHDNLSWTFTDNGAAITSFSAENSTIEYCRFDNNGSSSSTSHNNGHILMSSIQNNEDIVAANGYNPVTLSEPGAINFTIRYNHFSSSSYSGGTGGPYATVGIKDKGGQFYTGRNPDAGHGWDDTYENYGHKIHHNFFDKLGREAVFLESDFAQVYQNIFTQTGTHSYPSIAVQYATKGRPQLYRVAVYNNTIIDPNNLAIIRYGQEEDRWNFTQDFTHFGYDLNNRRRKRSRSLGTFRNTYSYSMV
jgi:hypothetical protein